MIDNLSGIIQKKKEDYIVLDVNGIGYKIKISSNCFESLPSIGENFFIIVFLYVRENILDLYGFKDKDERNSFNLLINIGGIGPKLAMTILSGLSFRNLKKYIIDGDVKSLTMIPGVGSKTAKRMIIELKEKFISLENDDLGINDGQKNKSLLFENVLRALVTLGFKSNQARVACNQIIKDDDFKGNIEDIIKKALVILMK